MTHGQITSDLEGLYQQRPCPEDEDEHNSNQDDCQDDVQDHLALLWHAPAVLELFFGHAALAVDLEHAEDEQDGHDGIKDVIMALDTNSDGIIDRIGWDINGDGKIDKEIDRNSDNTWPDTPTVPSGLATATYGIPDLTEPEVHRPLGLSVDLSWGQGMVFPEIPLGVKERK